jgi:hypothetical protein
MDSQCFAKEAANPAVTDNNFLVLQTVIVLSFRQRDQFSPGPLKARGRRVRLRSHSARESMVANNKRTDGDTCERAYCDAR